MSPIPIAFHLALAAFAPLQETHAFRLENRFEIDVPADAKAVHGWFALPSDRDPLQTVLDLKWSVNAPGPAQTALQELRDEQGNRFLYLEAADAAGQKLVLLTTFRLTRKEARHAIDPSRSRAPTEAELGKLAADLAPDAHVAITPDMRALAASIVGDEENPVRKGRLLYDWVLANVSYWVKHPDTMKASPVGSSEYCLTNKCGNCTDFHSLYASLARAVELPTRIVYGSFLKGPLAGVDQDQSYHCWIEFWAPELGWIPLDVAIADVFVDDFQISEANAELVKLTTADGYSGPDPKMVEYYFGNLDARRVTWNVGRDLELFPAPAAGALNALPKAFVEVDGKPLAEKAGWTRKLTFTELP